MKTNRLALKTIACLTLFFFLGSDIARAIPVGGITLSSQKETPSFFQIEIPEELASIEEIYEAPATQEPQMIVHVQNIHAHYESQLQIRKLLGYLHKQYGFKLIFAEGAVQKLKPEYLHLFHEKELNLQFADHLARQGEITGVEYYMVDGPEGVEALGIEETELYRKNYQAFKDVYAAKAQSAAFLEAVDQKSEMLSSHTFSKDTRRVLREWKKFQEGARDFLPFVKRLTQEAKQHAKLDLESLFAQVEWPQITRLLTLQKMEKELNPEAAEKEKNQLMEFLKSKSLSEALVKDLENKEKLPRFIFEKLLKEAGPKGFQFHDYPHFSLWAGYQILSAELESKTLFNEIDKLFLKTLNALTVTEKEKTLFALFQDIELLKKLFRLELTKKEWKRTEYRKEWLKPGVILGRIQSFLAPFGGEDQGEGALEETFQTALNFYNYAHQRDEVFYENIQKQMQERNTQKAVLVTGGFHTQGLTDIFRENQINYSVLMPRIKGEVGNEKYIENMLETRPIFDINTVELAATTQDADILTKVLRSIPYEVGRRILNWDTFYEENVKNLSGYTRDQRIDYVNASPYAKDRNFNIKTNSKNNSLQIHHGPQYSMAASESRSKRLNELELLEKRELLALAEEILNDEEAYLRLNQSGIDRLLEIHERHAENNVPLSAQEKDSLVSMIFAYEESDLAEDARTREELEPLLQEVRNYPVVEAHEKVFLVQLFQAESWTVRRRLGAERFLAMIQERMERYESQLETFSVEGMRPIEKDLIRYAATERGRGFSLGGERRKLFEGTREDWLDWSDTIEAVLVEGRLPQDPLEKIIGAEQKNVVKKEKTFSLCLKIIQQSITAHV